MAELGLNIFQVLQNELITREGNRSTIGIGFRLLAIEERIKNSEAISRNGRIWRPTHSIHAISAVTPETRAAAESSRRKLLDRRGAKKDRDEHHPGMLVREEEKWAVHRHFPRTVHDFKQLQYHPERIRSLLDFYDVYVYRQDLHLIDTDPGDRLHDIRTNLVACLEELAITFGLDWAKIGGLSVPALIPPPPSPVPPAQMSGARIATGTKGSPGIGTGVGTGTGVASGR